MNSLPQDSHAAVPPVPGASDPSDRSLLRRLRGGNQDAATQLYLRYANRLHALARARLPVDLASRVDVEDIVQSVFGSFFRGVGQGFYDVPAGEDLWKLFLVITLNKIRAKGAFHRAAKRDVRMTTGNEDLEQMAAAWGEEMALAILQMTIDETMAQMSPQHRQVLTLRIDGYEVAEIAQRVSRSKRTVERMLQECRKYLASLLDGPDDTAAPPEPRTELGSQ